MPGLRAGHDHFRRSVTDFFGTFRRSPRRSDPGHAAGENIVIEFLSQETAMKAIKALIIVAALAIATFMIGVGKYNAQYADVHHGFSSHHAA
jgi:hypothetical protein